MAAKRRTKKKRSTSHVSNSDAPGLLRSLASAIASSQVLQTPILKSLWYLLVHLSSNQPVCWDRSDVVSHSFNIKADGEEMDLKFEDIHILSDVLFLELDKRFNELFSTPCKRKPSVIHKNAQGSIEEAALLLRCCTNLLTLLMCNQEVALEKAKALLPILSKLISGQLRTKNMGKSFVFARPISRGFMDSGNGHTTKMAGDLVSSIYFSGPSDPCYAFILSGLEVFVDEILVNKSMRDLLLLADSAFSSSRLFSTHAFGWFSMSSVLEVVAAHFIHSLSDEKMIEAFIHRLYWKQENEFRTPQISLNGAISLLLNPVILSSPRLFHAYVLLLAKDAIGINESSRVKELDLQLFDRYLDAFQRSVSLYTRVMSNVDKEKGEKHGVSTNNSHIAFESLLLQPTLEKVNIIVMKFNDSWASYLSSISNRENAELIASSFAHAKENLLIFGNSCSEVMSMQILSILGCLILRACSDDVIDSVLQNSNTTSTQDLYLVGSTLKLMSCSMLQAMQSLGDGMNWLSSKTTSDLRAGKKYKAMMDTVQIFEQFSVNLPSQSFLHDRMEHVKSKWMLMHFSGLLSMGYAHKLEFLMKDSIFAMILSLYLFILEEGDLQTLKDLVSGSESSPSGKSSEVASERKSSQTIAMKYQKIRTLYLGKISRSDEQDIDSAVGLEEESCNGESFLRCMVSRGALKPSEIEDLSDFIVCEPGKDYSDWLNGREKFRQRWKSEKMETYRWGKKRKAWRENRRKIT